MKSVYQFIFVCLLWIVGISGCGHQSPIFTLDKQFNSYQVELIHKSADKWNTVLIEPITVVDDVEPTTDHGLWRIVLAFPDPGTGFTGQCNADHSGWHRTIRVAPYVVDDYLYPLMLHEMGHSVGLKHIAPKTGVMNGSQAETEFSADDLIQCRRIGRCY